MTISSLLKQIINSYPAPSTEYPLSLSYTQSNFLLILKLKGENKNMPSELSVPEMTAPTKEILSKVQRMIPPMLEKFHKGRSVAALRPSVPRQKDSLGGRWRTTFFTNI
jgi:hypothetical protein